MWFVYLYLTLLTLTCLFFVVVNIVENRVKEDTTFMKWWRKHVIGIAPDDFEI